MALSNSFTYNDLLDAGSGKLFGPDGPQLPAPPMLMFDRVKHISGKGGSYNRGEIVAELDIRPDLWFFDCHFKGDPVMPGCLGVDALWQLVGFFLGWRGGKGKGRALGAGDIKFMGQVRPTAQRVTYNVSIRRSKISSASIAFADGLVYSDQRLVYDCRGLKVGLFDQSSLAAMDQGGDS